MIFYFSATGNSKWVAQEIAKLTGDEALDMAVLRKIKAPHYEPAQGETIGFVFPVYAWRAPNFVIEFASGMTFEDSNFIFAVGTCGSEAGNTMKHLSQFLPLDSAYSVQMPNNYVKGYPVEKPETIEAYIKSAKIRLPEIAREINEKKPTKAVVRGKFAGLKTGLIGSAFNNFALKTDGFAVEDTCTSCGKCVEVCPIDTITLKNGKPVWGKACTQCAACIHHCPVGAISDGAKSKKNGQYTFERDGAKYL